MHPLLEYESFLSTKGIEAEGAQDTVDVFKTHPISEGLLPPLVMEGQIVFRIAYQIGSVMQRVHAVRKHLALILRWIKICFVKI
jgi:hypothetical protein